MEEARGCDATVDRPVVVRDGGDSLASGEGGGEPLWRRCVEVAHAATFTYRREYRLFVGGKFGEGGQFTIMA